MPEVHSQTRQYEPPRKRLQPRDVLVRAASAELLRQSNTPGKYEDVLSVIARHYAGCPATKEYIARAATAPANSTTATWAAELVASSVADFVANDMASSGFAQLAARALNVPFDSVGSVKVPGRSSPLTLMGAWVAEGGPKPVFAGVFGATTLSAYKLACVSAFSEEMLMASSIEQIVREALAHDLTALLDTALFDAAAASAVRPAGLFNGATAVTASATTPLNEAMIADLKALAAAVSSANPDARVAFVANPLQAIRIGIMAPNYANLITSGYMPAGSVGAIDVSAIAMIVGQPQFAISNSAALHMDTAATALSAVGSPNTVAAPMSSMFQADLQALRSVLRAGWAKRRAAATALATGITW